MGYELVTYRFIVNALTNCAQFLEFWERIFFFIKLYFISLSISIKSTSWNESVPYHLQHHLVPQGKTGSFGLLKKKSSLKKLKVSRLSFYLTLTVHINYIYTNNLVWYSKSRKCGAHVCYNVVAILVICFKTKIHVYATYYQLM